MNEIDFELPDHDTFIGAFLTLIALTGEFPAEQVSRLDGSPSYHEKVVVMLKRKKLIRTYYQNGLRGFHLTAAAKRLLASQEPHHFAALFSGKTVTNAPKYDAKRRLRHHLMSEVLVTMHNAGVIYLPWEKPGIFKEGEKKPLPVVIERPVYYTSREIKAIGPRSKTITSSRSTGVLLTDDKILAVFNTSNMEMRWHTEAETRLKTLLNEELCQTRLPRQYRKTEISALMLADNMGQMTAFMYGGRTQKSKYDILNGVFSHFYYLTNDHAGELILKTLYDRVLQCTLDSVLSDDLSPRVPDAGIENDGFDANGDPVLFGYTCDMPRILRFNNALSEKGGRGTLICFDFQEDALRSIFGDKVRYQTLDFSVVERSDIYRQEETD